MSQGPLCPNLSQKVQKEVSQMANRNLSCVILLGGLSVNLNHLKKDTFLSLPMICRLVMLIHCKILYNHQWHPRPIRKCQSITLSMGPAMETVQVLKQLKQKLHYTRDLSRCASTMLTFAKKFFQTIPTSLQTSNFNQKQMILDMKATRTNLWKHLFLVPHHKIILVPNNSGIWVRKIKNLNNLLLWKIKKWFLNVEHELITICNHICTFNFSH